ncbi:MAG TPA: TOBE domain-containing protein [Candidatus Bathyarchaeota archaeon]|nr:TOBE domain-containing protein [Candidatus Bathyarchaeota archaeon]
MSISDRVVVMRKGRIVEAGRPLELYIRPKRLFTANFVGEANFLAGEISRVAENGSIIDLGNNMKLASTDKSRRAGERVVIAFRPEFAAIRKEKGRNTLPGKIINTIYSGNLLRLTIELPGGDEITVKKTIRTGEAFPRLGERVMVNIPPESVLVYPYPEGGLHRELSLD